jgi:hypothetical protein
MIKKKISRRTVLRGIGGATLALPFLEGLVPRQVKASDEVPPFAIFFRQANGVAQQQSNDEIGDEPERFFPRTLGALDTANVQGRALEELDGYLDQILVLKNVNTHTFDYGDGHARGVMQSLTARGPVVAGAGGDSEADGESLDHRIGAEVNEGGRESLVLYSGGSGGWLGGPCISYRSSNVRRAADRDPWVAYQNIMGADGGLSAEAQMMLVERQMSVNDLVRDQLTRLQSSPRLSGADHDRLQLHLDSIRDLEVALTCRAADDVVLALEGNSPSHVSTDGDEVLTTARYHMDVAALAVACGYTRSVSIQIGSGNDGSTRYRNLSDGSVMENYHYLSHRRASHDSTGGIIPNSDLLHHYVDVHFAQAFRHLVERLDAYMMPTGRSLLWHGMAIWHNDNSNGPPHGFANVPWVIAGSACGYLRQGEYVEVQPGNRDPNHNKLLNTIGTAAGVTKADGSPLDDFGDPMFERGLLTDIIAS